MSRIRYALDGIVEVLSPLHVGTGEAEESDLVESGDRTANESASVATIVRDGNGRPYLPATTLKGLLRRLAEAGTPSAPGHSDGLSATDRLLGRIKSSDMSGQMGALLVRGATFSEPGSCKDAPFVRDDGKSDPGIFIAARTRIDPESGTAHDSALFHQEMVAIGTRFHWRAVMETRTVDADLEELLVSILVRFAEADGHSIGRGAADGAGRIRLVADRTSLTLSTLGETGDFVEDRNASSTLTVRLKEALAPPLRVAMTRNQMLRLRCRGPFVVIDSSRRSKKTSAANHGKEPQIRAQRIDGTPLISGAGVAGALRARARWLEGLWRLRKGIVPVTVDEPALVRRMSDVATLDPVQRLFGVTGFRGLMRVMVTSVGADGIWDVTSVKLDRLSGGPIDNALFTTQTFVNVGIEFALTLESRGEVVATAEDEALFDALVADIKDNGLQLGHGANKGFGWFAHEEAK
jgi:CRISPR/Cas system CSM-associated protein Csm3 (group 7 of RAMP superfamily)